MRKIPTLFQRDYEGNRQVVDEITPGCEWVLDGEGMATEKFDGTACMIRDGVLYRRYDRRPYHTAHAPAIAGERALTEDSFKPAPDDWEPCESEPDFITGHWPGWIPVGNGADDKYHREALENDDRQSIEYDGTYELVGPKIQGNPYDLEQHQFWLHGADSWAINQKDQPPRTFVELKKWLQTRAVEGIVWHHRDGRMAKIKRYDFGLKWPI